MGFTYKINPLIAALVGLFVITVIAPISTLLCGGGRKLARLYRLFSFDDWRHILHRDPSPLVQLFLSWCQRGYHNPLSNAQRPSWAVCVYSYTLLMCNICRRSDL